MEMHGAPHLVDLHDNAQTFFEHSSLGSKIQEAIREKLYNYLCKKKCQNKLQLFTIRGAW